MARTTRLKEKLIKLEEEVKRLKAIETVTACRARSAGLLPQILIPARWRPAAGAALGWSAIMCKRPSIRRTI